VVSSLVVGGLRWLPARTRMYLLSLPCPWCEPPEWRGEREIGRVREGELTITTNTLAGHTTTYDFTGPHNVAHTMWPTQCGPHNVAHTMWPIQCGPYNVAHTMWSTPYNVAHTTYHVPARAVRVKAYLACTDSSVDGRLNHVGILVQPAANAYSWRGVAEWDINRTMSVQLVWQRRHVWSCDLPEVSKQGGGAQQHGCRIGHILECKV